MHVPREHQVGRTSAKERRKTKNQTDNKLDATWSIIRLLNLCTCCVPTAATSPSIISRAYDRGDARRSRVRSASCTAASKASKLERGSPRTHFRSKGGAQEEEVPEGRAEKLSSIGLVSTFALVATKAAGDGVVEDIVARR
jgi:hypothetical protein